MKWSSLVLVALAICSTGCTQTQLRVNTVRKAESLNDIYQQQVLDNLAKFIVDPNSLPHFAVPTQGTSAVNDQLTSEGNLGWNATILNAAGLKGSGQRQTQENWVLVPVSDPRKLERMRCAYQMVVSRCGFCTLGSCPDHQQVLNKFYTGSAKDSSWMEKNDRVSTQCLLACEPWFGTGKDAPRKGDCLLVGKSCDQYVWVAPHCRDQLAKLTLCILDFALNDAAKTSLKTVKLFVGPDGTATNEATATQVIETLVPTDVTDVSKLTVSNIKPAATEVANPPAKEFDASEMIDNDAFRNGIRTVPLLEFKERLDALGP